jgi:hypothetical protein
MRIQSTILVNGGVPWVLGQHFETFGFIEVLVTLHDPMPAKSIIDCLRLGALEAALAHNVQISQGSIHEEEINELRIIIGQVCGHSSSKRPAKASYHASDPELLQQKLEDSFPVMVTGVRIGVTLGPPIISIIPSHHINLI